MTHPRTENSPTHIRKSSSTFVLSFSTERNVHPSWTSLDDLTTILIGLAVIEFLFLRIQSLETSLLSMRWLGDPWSWSRPESYKVHPINNPIANLRSIRDERFVDTRLSGSSSSSNNNSSGISVSATITALMHRFTNILS